MLYIRGTPTDLRQGFTRRDLLRVGLGASCGLVWPALVRGDNRGADAHRSPSSSFGRAKSVIILYLFGGPSHIDTWDMKPTAPDGIRGEFKPIPTNMPGVQISEHMPRLATMIDKFAVIRSMSHGDSNHGSAGHTLLTGRRPKIIGEVGPNVDDFPHYGAVMSRLRPAKPGIPPFVSLPWQVWTSTAVVPGQTGGFLGRAMDPFKLELPPDNSPKFTAPLATLPEEVSSARLQDRLTLRGSLPDGLKKDSNAREMGLLYERAFGLLTSPEAARAFDIDREPPALRERYGMNAWGQSVLMARRLVEAGVPAITVYWPDRKELEARNNNGTIDPVGVPAWDTHGWHVGRTPNFPSLRDKLCPPLDLALTALMEDLTSRGLLDQTLVVVSGEFGRSPRVNKDAGRDHYGNVFSTLLAGGGIRTGQVYGSSDRIGAFPLDNPVSPAAFAATLYHCLGFHPETIIHDRLGRPVPIAEGEPVGALLL